MPIRPDRTLLAPGLEISRVVTGLWQVADMERNGRLLDRDTAASAMADYARDGFDSFDMADHYGSAELITGRFLSMQTGTEKPRPTAFTKWCPTPGLMTADVVRAGIAQRLDRLGVELVDLLQFHWWMFEHPGYIDAMKELVAMQQEGHILHLGTTNFDTDHLPLGKARLSDRLEPSLLLPSRPSRRGGHEHFLSCRRRAPASLRYTRGRLPDGPLGGCARANVH
jgi:aryl-alcohol dehydrogenase-like predicted oxidoreductase